MKQLRTRQIWPKVRQYQQYIVPHSSFIAYSNWTRVHVFSIRAMNGWTQLRTLRISCQGFRLKKPGYPFWLLWRYEL